MGGGTRALHCRLLPLFKALFVETNPGTCQGRPGCPGLAGGGNQAAPGVHFTRAPRHGGESGREIYAGRALALPFSLV